MLRKFFVIEKDQSFFQLTDWENSMVSQAFANPSSYCLKILREGGHLGNIFEAKEVVETLEKMKTDFTLR